MNVPENYKSPREIADFISEKMSKNTIELCDAVFNMYESDDMDFEDKFYNARELLAALLHERFFASDAYNDHNETLELKNGTWVAKTDAGWLPGVYATRLAAQMAIGINYEILNDLWCSKFDEFDKLNAAPITINDLINLESSDECYCFECCGFSIDE